MMLVICDSQFVKEMNCGAVVCQNKRREIRDDGGRRRVTFLSDDANTALHICVFQGLKKPYNPILGETFRCCWLHPQTDSCTFYIAEQVKPDS